MTFWLAKLMAQLTQQGTGSKVRARQPILPHARTQAHNRLGKDELGQPRQGRVLACEMCGKAFGRPGTSPAIKVYGHYAQPVCAVRRSW